MSQRVLVTYGTSNGTTRHVAEVLADQLRRDHVVVDVAPALEIHLVDGYDAVVLGGAVFASHWHDDARRFARRHAVALLQRPVWLFSCVPVGDATPTGPVRGAVQAMLRLHARDHATFSADDASVRHWAASISAALSSSDPGQSMSAPSSTRSSGGPPNRY